MFALKWIKTEQGSLSKCSKPYRPYLLLASFHSILGQLHAGNTLAPDGRFPISCVTLNLCKGHLSIYSTCPAFSLSQRRTYYSNDYAHLYMLFAMLALAEEPTVIPPIYMIPPIVNVCPGQEWTPFRHPRANLKRGYRLHNVLPTIPRCLCLDILQDAKIRPLYCRTSYRHMAWCLSSNTEAITFTPL